MPFHQWDDGFDFTKLEKAGTWIATFYRRLTGKNMIWKEKYGTIRYEFTYFWLSEDDEAIILFEILRRATVKFPKLAAEIVDDMAYCISDGERSTYYKGYFDGILWGQCQSRYIPQPRRYSFD